MKPNILALSLLSMTLTASAALQAASPKAGGNIDRRAVENVIREYLLAHPEILEEAQTALQHKQQQAKAAQVRQVLLAEKAALFESSASPSAGASDGDVTVVEFFDYRCGYCKRAASAVKTLLERDAKARIVLKEFPILGPESVFAAKAALAAQRQNKYLQLHNALLTSDWATQGDVLELAAKSGLDMEKLKLDMTDTAIVAELAQNQRLAGALEVNGTPAFIVGERLIPGAIDGEALVQVVQAERLKHEEKSASVAAGVKAKR